MIDHGIYRQTCNILEYLRSLQTDIKNVGFMFGPCFIQLCSLLLNPLDEEEASGCFTFIVFSLASGRNLPGRVAQSVTCLKNDTSLPADPGIASSIPARSHTFTEIDYESFFPLPLNHSRRIVVSYKRQYVHEVQVLTACSSLTRKKLSFGELTVPP